MICEIYMDKIFSRIIFDVSFNYMAYVKSRFNKDQLTNPTLLQVALALRAWLGRSLNFCNFKKLESVIGKLTHLACMALLITSIIILVMLHHSSSMQNENEQFRFVSKYWQ